ncbi:MAG: hypothetical protein LBR29_06060, partial [Methylobacteriaceae bacterium]|nr:hypothetical protein [Methylobacteriaceae bacterium]
RGHSRHNKAFVRGFDRTGEHRTPLMENNVTHSHDKKNLMKQEESGNNLNKRHKKTAPETGGGAWEKDIRAYRE